MPPAIVLFLSLSWLENTYLRTPPRPGPPQIDTALKAAEVERTVDGAVVIEREPEPLEAEEEDLGASAHNLETVRDDTVFRPGDEEAWFQIWMRLQSSDIQSLLQSKPRQVSFAELFGQPRSFRGRLVRFKGAIRGMQRVEAPANNYNVKGYWQAWVEPDDGPASPIVVYFLRVPEGMPQGMKLREPVEVVGYFFKRWAYQAKDTIRTAPLVMALEPIWKPLEPPPGGGTAVGSYALLTMAAVVLLTLLGLRMTNTTPARGPAQGPGDLSATLAGVELFSPDEALRKMEQEQKSADRAAEKEPSDDPG
jgi:hypothetical protein